MADSKKKEQSSENLPTTLETNNQDQPEAPETSVKTQNAPAAEMVTKPEAPETLPTAVLTHKSPELKNETSLPEVFTAFNINSLYFKWWYSDPGMPRFLYFKEIAGHIAMADPNGNAISTGWKVLPKYMHGASKGVNEKLWSQVLDSLDLSRLKTVDAPEEYQGKGKADKITGAVTAENWNLPGQGGPSERDRAFILQRTDKNGKPGIIYMLRKAPETVMFSTDHNLPPQPYPGTLPIDQKGTYMKEISLQELDEACPTDWFSEIPS